jgi:hypothetical protein
MKIKRSLVVFNCFKNILLTCCQLRTLSSQKEAHMDKKASSACQKAFFDGIQRKETILTLNICATSLLRRLMSLGALKGVLIATCITGILCVCPSIWASNDEKSVDVLLELAEKGDPEAQYNIGVIYFFGKEVPQNQANAFTWFKKAAEQGYNAAQYALGRMYYYGQGVQKDGDQAAAWFRKAAEKGYADAQFALGVMCQFGKYVGKDLDAAVKWYRSASDSGLAAAQYALGTMYSLGEGVEKDLVKGIEWLKKSSAQNYGPAGQTLLIIESKSPDVEIKIREVQGKLPDSL